MLDQRNWETNLVRLSGDIGVVDDLTDNCYHVFHHPEDSLLDATAVLDGCIISDGYGNVVGGDNRRGCGMYNEDASPTIINCTFENNHTVGSSYTQGGGLYNRSSSPAIINCIFQDNSAQGRGGALFNNSSAPTVVDCTFQNNHCDNDGGAVYNSSGCDAIYSGCQFLDNSSDFNGGAMCNVYSTSQPKMINCSFFDNTTGMYGGAIYNNNGSTPEFVQCVFSRNRALVGNGHGGVAYNFASSPTFTNCVLYDNESGCVGNGIYCFQFAYAVVTNCILSGSDVLYCTADSDPVVTYCNIQQSGFDGAELHNTAGNPLLVDPDNGDFHILPESPCIDAGSNSALPHDFADLDEDNDFTELTPLDFFGITRCIDNTDVVDSGEGDAPLVDVGIHETGSNSSPVTHPNSFRVNSFPNPFNPVTTIEYNLPSDSKVSLKIFNCRGAFVAEILNRQQLAGPHQAVWNGLNQEGLHVSSGVYYAVLRTDKGTARKKMVMVK